MVTDKELLELIEEIDPYLPSSVKIIAVGGTAMTLQQLKTSTIDVDFDIPNHEEYEAFKRTLEKLGFQNIRPGASNLKVIAPNGIILDIFSKNYIFCVQLIEPVDSIEIKKYKKIELHAINPYDLIITKTARSDTRDYEDIAALAQASKIDYTHLYKRYKASMQQSQVYKPAQLLHDILHYLKNKKVHIPETVFEATKKWITEESQTP